MPPPFSPSAEALAFLADPANRNTWSYDVSALPAERAARRVEGEAMRPGILARTGVTLDWQDVAGIETLVITPGGWDGSAQALYLFGGAFIMGGPIEDLMISAALAAQTGLQVLSPAYRLAPEAPFPAGLDDALAVARAMHPRAVIGESAGGNFAVSVTRALVEDGTPPAALALLSPAVDMSPAFDPYDAPDDPTLYPPLVADLPGHYAPGTDPFDPRLSPLYCSFSSAWPPCLITTGTRDMFLIQCARLARAMREAEAPVNLRVWDSLWHVFEYYPDIPEAAASLAEIARFLTEVTPSE
ncbi:hypothetical protein EI983_14370 [Roseovarius faecimaris]|uniref:Alpha/beta hydrolase fold-3 domain-containing protein n=1 Tax=Roseovarius faecimaris TaxID=2494550 RepID=A0A6I6IT57_9RHOB|nr:alpha/beta hydrolase fold domain-containing protein [Roseovarius faecimaris]QGX99382.1 hypothetical protein EI983_14370 [Roseovarius faecimaris]